MAKTNNAAQAKGQKNLFSFFSKKPSAASSKPSAPSANKSSIAPAVSSVKSAHGKTNNDTTQPPPAAPAAVSRPSNKSDNSTAQPTPAQLKQLQKITIGTKLAVYWPDDEEYYPCVVTRHRIQAAEGNPGHMYEINYDDGEIETVDLSKEKFRILGGIKRSNHGGNNDDDGNNTKNVNEGNKMNVHPNKRRRILEDTDEEEEMEFESEEEDDDDDSGSEFKMNEDESMDDSLDVEEGGDDTDNWLASEDEEEDEDDFEEKKPKTLKKKKTVLKVTEVGGGTNDRGRFVSPTPRKVTGNDAKKSSANDMSTMDFSNFASQSPAQKNDAMHKKPPIINSNSNSNSNNDKSSSPPPQTNSNSTTTTKNAPPKPIAGVVNSAGSHLHNHLKFFTTHRKDGHGHPTTHPNYSPRSLQVALSEIERESGAKVSPAQKQWWDIKSQYADCVLLFKTGKFYEMFHDDADVGVKVLGFVYMKGTLAHAGFPEAAYDKMLTKLVDAGYRVARVEQTETPDALKERKKKAPTGKKPQVVCREVCGIVAKGTRTYCFLEDASVLEKGNGGGNGRGPLLTIKEIMLEDSGGEMMECEEDETGTKAVCEYGVTIVDAVTGAVTMGQFADDVLRSRMQTLLASFGPSEVLYEGGLNGASKTLISLLKSSCPPNTIFNSLQPVEKFPKSFAVELKDRQTLDRVKSDVHPWDSDEALKELHRKGYYPRSSRKNEPSSGAEGISRWPEILRSCIQGGATLALQSFGAALFYLQTSLIDVEILSMGIVKPYCPPNNVGSGDDKSVASNHLEDMYSKEAHQIDGRSLVETDKPVDFGPSLVPASLDSSIYEAEASIDHMALDGRTLTNLEILNNITSGGYQGSLLSKIDVTQSPHGSRLLRAWLLRPLFRKADIDRRADVVEELAGGAVAVAMAEARPLLKKIGDIERLLSRVHSMGGEGGNGDSHPNDRAVLYEMDKYTKRKVGDFSKLLNGLRAAAEIPELFANAEIQSPMLEKIVRTTDENGCFPAEMKERLDWFFDNFDLKKAARGEFEPSRGMDDDYDAACNEIEDIQRELQNYKDEMCSSVLQPRNTARSSWKYINLKEDSKDKYLIELPISVQVPDDFYVKAKRGKGANQVNKYRTPVVEQLVQDLERAIDVKNERKAAGMQLVFAKFDSMRSVWMAATHASAMLDALGSLAQIASQPGFCRPQIMDCPPSAKPGIEVIQGRHPCVDVTHSGGDFIPNDLVLGGRFESDGSGDESSVLLLSGPNMGGKSTLLRQTCLITILAQVGSFVPAESCSLTPVDRIFTRLGASDRILCGQSTFFVELAETAAAVRGATRRSLVIMDELGRGTSTFDGTAIASATVQHLVERNQCLTLFATHYHSLLEDWKNEPSIRLGHMECVVEDDDDSEKKSITFLYTLGDGPCPKSFGVNVARLAGLPDDVLERAKRVSVAFEAEMNGESTNHKIIPSEAEDIVSKIEKLFSTGADLNHGELKQIWEGLQ
mmetsp:Transcript_5021/g.8245  ORF Transcript_5021/g.8245 Transcript_5021/m.8245 type:complete len:1485 (-) Transcript_5021:2972-7426(-)